MCRKNNRWNARYFKRILFLLTLFVIYANEALLVAQRPWQSQHIRIHRNGTISYVPDRLGNIIPDFSGVGYRQGQVPIPQLAVTRSIEPTGDDDVSIQKAIDELGMAEPDKQGFRGVLLLKKGVYKIKTSLRISQSGIVLRGEGADTKIIAVGTGQRNLINVAGKGAISEIAGTKRTILDNYVAVGSFSFRINDASVFKKGDKIILKIPGTDRWITDIKMNRIDIRDSATRQWTAKEYDLLFERTIIKVDGNRVFIDNPVMMAMEKKYGGGEIYKYTFEGRIRQVGVENLLLESEYMNDEDEDHGWTGIFMNRVEDAWVRNVESRYFGFACVNLGWQSKQVTVDACRSVDPKSKITGSRRYSFNNDGQLNLVQNCYASNGRHDFVTGAKTCGPNVFYNCKAENSHADIGPHHRWSVGTLYDNVITDGEINVQDRGNWGTGHGWAGVTQVLWNCSASKVCVQSPWASGANYAIGVMGEKYSGRLAARPDGIWEGHNQPGIVPSSLFDQQLKARKKR